MWANPKSLFREGRGPRLPACPRAAALCMMLAALWGCACEKCGHGPDPECVCTAVLPHEAGQGEPYVIVLEEFDLLSPFGERIHGMIRRPDPDAYADLCFAAVILVPGGINPGRLLARGYEARLLAEAGMVVVTFNAQGRADDSGEDIASEGAEDFNGFRNQDTLREIIQYVLARDYVIAENIGVKTQSFGIAMGAGCLGRYPELPVKYLVDGEGPPNSYVTAQEPWALDADSTNDKHETVREILGHYSTARDPSPENLAFWAEREAIRFIGAFRGRYLRLQAEWDHSQPPGEPSQIPTFTRPPAWWQCKHAMDIVSAAVEGGVPWVRVNLAQHGNPPNGTYAIGSPPVYLPGELADEVWDVRAIIEMARME